MIGAIKDRILAICPEFVRSAWQRVEGSELRYRLVRGAFWTLAGTAISRSLSLAATILVARLLGKEEFGALGIIQSTVGMFGPLAGLGLGLTATKHIAEFRGTDAARASRILSLSAVVSWAVGGMVAIIVALMAPWIATELLHAPRLSVELRIASLLILLDAVNGTQVGALAGFEAFRPIAKLSLYNGLLNFPCLLIGCWLFGLQGVVWGLVVALAIGCGINRWALARECRRHGVPIWTNDWRREIAVLWHFSLPAVAALLVTAVARWISHVIIVRQPAGLAAMATCAIGGQIQTLILFLPGLVTQASFPILSDLAGRGEWHRAKSFIRKNVILNLAVTSAVCVPLMLFARQILGLYGPAYQGDAGVLVIFLVTAILMSASRFLLQVLASQNAMHLSFVINVVWSILLVGIVMMYPLPGAMAFAVAQLVAYSAHFGMPLAFLHRRFNAKPN